jgi:hypothetical protein
VNIGNRLILDIISIYCHCFLIGRDVPSHLLVSKIAIEVAMAPPSPKIPKDFGSTAKGLASNPLGIIALFIVLVYAFASLVVGAGSVLDAASMAPLTPLIWFMVGFPVLVLIVFAWLVSRHYEKLYAPRDYGQGEFLEALKALKARTVRSEALEFQVVKGATPSESTATAERGEEGPGDIPFGEAPRGEAPPEAPLGWEDTRYRDSDEIDPEDLALTTPSGREIERGMLYDKFRRVFIVHVLTPSEQRGQEYDIFIYLIRHNSDSIDDVEKAEFFFGKYWRNDIFEGQREGNLIGVRTSAYGSFLATCRVTFADGYQVSLYRYIDLEMGNIAHLAGSLISQREL